MRQVKKRKYASVSAAKAAIFFIWAWDWMRFSLGKEKVMSKRYSVTSFVEAGVKKYRVVRFVVTQRMLDDLETEIREDSTQALESSLYDTVHRVCQACHFERHGIKSKRPVPHTCGKRTKR